VPIYARSAEVACLVFDASNQASFDSLDEWVRYIELVVVSNKCDLEPVVSVDRAGEFCASRGIPLVVTSAIAGTNIDLLFRKIATIVFEDAITHLGASQEIVLGERHADACC
jgi:GTPase SAR1 family protein